MSVIHHRAHRGHRENQRLNLSTDFAGQKI
jgi:hypothetical protein